MTVQDLVLLIRLDPAMGYSNMGDVMDLAGRLHEHGINAIAEASPGAPMGAVSTFQIRVPADQFEKASEVLVEIMQND